MFGFGKKDPTRGGMMDVIRCDESEYLIWKWRPSAAAANSTTRENAIRWGSSLRVKDGEVAVFVYSKRGVSNPQEFITGPRDEILSTANLPVLASIIGAAYDGNSPFQAEVYFINTAGNVPLKFAVPYFDVFDPRFLDFAVPCAVRGTILINVTDVRGLIKLNRLINFELDDFYRQIKAGLTKFIKSFVTNAPTSAGIPVLQLERKLLEINDLLEPRIRAMLESDFGVNLKRLDLSAIEFDKESEGYRELRQVTAVQQTNTIEAQTSVGIKNMQDQQAIQATNIAESLRIQRETLERQQRLQIESQFLTTHQLNLQADVAKTAATSLGTMGSGIGSGGVNPAAMVTGLAVGGAVGNMMAGQLQGFIGGMGPQAGATGMMQPPPMPGPPAPMPALEPMFMMALGGQQVGPLRIAQIIELVRSGQAQASTLVWTTGMTAWAPASGVPQLALLFATPPTIP
jgi:membrane protease subunit (stomatin/prohibitin family)